MGEIIARNKAELIEIINKIIIVASSWLFILLRVLKFAFTPFSISVTNVCLFRALISFHVGKLRVR